MESKTPFWTAAGSTTTFFIGTAFTPHENIVPDPAVAPEMLNLAELSIRPILAQLINRRPNTQIMKTYEDGKVRFGSNKFTLRSSTPRNRFLAPERKRFLFLHTECPVRKQFDSDLLKS